MENQMFCYQCRNCRMQWMYSCWSLWKTARCRCHAGFIGLCYKRNFCGNYYFKTGRSSDSASSQSHDYTEFIYYNHQCQLQQRSNYRPDSETLSEKDLLLSKLTNKDTLPEAALWNGSVEEFDTKAAAVGVLSTENEDIRSLRELITYGLKGLSAYSKHANVLLQDNEEIDAFMQRALAATLDDSLSADDLIALTLETGKYGVDGMALLDNANTSTYGNPEITKVNIGVGTRPGILVSGHDLRDLEMLLKQTQGSGVDVYTHSEMLPAHYYPAFKNIQTSLATTEMHGGNRKRNLKASMARFS